MSLEEQTLERIKGRIDERVQMNAGTWIDWQYLIDAANLLQKVRLADLLSSAWLLSVQVEFRQIPISYLFVGVRTLLRDIISKSHLRAV